MSALGNLVVNLAVNAAQFTRDLGKAADDATRSFGAMQRDAKKAASAYDQVTSALTKLGVAVSAGAFIKVQMDAIHAIAALDDMAEATGASVEALSAIQR